ncbi:Mss4-like protein [Mrakia frigida]|uniref:guanine nucleotide exchange factor DSS4 n=1 Tax=Mrakia frigida TaxID=29902 RepID=UPI003FCBF542
MSSNPAPSASILELNLTTPSEPQPPTIPSSILSSLVNPGSSSSSRKSRPPIRTLLETGGHLQLVDSQGRNNVGIYCPREGCGCLILRKGDAEWREDGEGGMYDSSGPFVAPPASSSDTSSSSPNTSSDSSPSTTPYWLVSNSPFGFENAGFSRNVPSSIKDTKGSDLKLKYLICADCDLGPLGWSTEGGKEAWVAVERVGYGV